MKARAAIAFAVTALVLASCGKAAVVSHLEPVTPVVEHRAPLRAVVDENAFRRAIAATRDRRARPMWGARVLIVPHHWLAGTLIMSTLQDAAAAGPWERVILIGPNHPDAGSSAVITSDARWTTTAGMVDPAPAAVTRLVSTGLARIEGPVLAREHSVSGLMAAVHHAMPRATVLPIILRSHQRLEDLRRLARVLRSTLNERTLIMASVDFSHGLSAREARARGEQTVEAMRALDSPRIVRMGNEHLDSPATIVVVMEIARALGADRFHLRANTDATAFGASPRAPATGYVTGYFS